MTNNTFMTMVRMYATLARRKRKSYADAIHTLAELRAATLVKEFPRDEDRARALSDMQAVLNREYAPNDDEFGIRSYD